MIWVDWRFCGISLGVAWGGQRKALGEKGIWGRLPERGNQGKKERGNMVLGWLHGCIIAFLQVTMPLPPCRLLVPVLAGIAEVSPSSQGY